jgi:hypothetical protein
MWPNWTSLADIDTACGKCALLPGVALVCISGRMTVTTCVIRGIVTKFPNFGVFFSLNNTPGPLIHGLKPFWILLRIRQDMVDFRTQNCILYVAPLNWSIFLVVGYDNLRTYTFLIDIPFKGCQFIDRACGVDDTAYTVHAVSMILHALCMQR